MFRVSRRVDYGLKLLIALAADQGSGSQATSRLAERLDIPLAFLHQIGRSLIQAGMVRSSPGPGGGLKLNQSPEKISLLQVLEALDGPVRLSTYLEQPEASKDESSRTSYEIWESIQSKLVAYLSGIRLSTLAEQAAAEGVKFPSLSELDPQKNPMAA
ncbi:MAG: Rrf2 family transcriptional regulator [Chloroflexi bacterium]|nr:Rrf2 family transcriptional regulator [Chloroflexota bacterium]